MAEIFPEIQAAAKWWADIMSAANVRQDNGDGFQSGFATLGRSSVAPLNADERSVFERILCDRLQEYVTREFGGWDDAKAKGEPHWASACRTVGVDYGPDKVLAGAGARVAGGDSRQEARISLLWPIKTHMWIDPGEVRVKHGYGAQAQRVYPVESATSRNAEAGAHESAESVGAQHSSSLPSSSAGTRTTPDWFDKWEAEAKRTEKAYPERAMAIRHVLQDLRQSAGTQEGR